MARDIDNPPTPPLFDVAPEVFTLIIDGLGQWELQHDLKALRLTCPQFAYLPTILERLFRRFRLCHTPEALHSLQKLDPGRFAPYVEEVTIYPSTYSLSMTKELFEEALNWQIVANNMEEKDRGIWDHVRSILTEEEKVQQIIDEHFNGISPFFPIEHIEAEYKLYSQAAETSSTLPFHQAWSDVLSKMVKCTSISVAQQKLDDDEFWHRKTALKHRHHTLLPRHPHHYLHHSIDTCRQAHAPSDNFFSNTITSLAISHLRLKHLDINLEHYGNFSWSCISAWSALDLSALESLSFSSHSRIPTNEESMDAVTATNLALLQQKSLSSLKTLNIGAGISTFSFIFPQACNMIAMPALQTLRIGSGCISRTRFSEFLKLQKGLERLELDSTHAEADSGTWREVWDAIRRHRKRMVVELLQVPVNSATELSCTAWNARKNDGDDEDEDDDDEDDDEDEEEDGDEDEDRVDDADEGMDEHDNNEENDDTGSRDDDDDDGDDDDDDDDEDDDQSVSSSVAWDDIDQSFPDYIGNKGSWNRTMQMWFET